MENAKFKSGFVTLIGRPNVGKSTLMNHLIGQKIAITSSKPQTTRNRIQTVYTSKRGQIIFLDTPGIHKAKNKLGEYMVTVAERTLKEVDVVLWLVEPTNFIGKGEQHIASQLRKAGVPVILIMNKTDTVEKSAIPGFLDGYRELLDFAAMIPVCALRGLQMDRVIDAIFRYLPYGPKYYDDDTVTDQPQRQIAAELIREKALRCLDEEVPHGIAVSIERMQERRAAKRPRGYAGKNSSAAVSEGGGINKDKAAKPAGQSAKAQKQPEGQSAKAQKQPEGQSAEPQTEPAGRNAEPQTEPEGQSAEPQTKPAGPGSELAERDAKPSSSAAFQSGRAQRTGAPAGADRRYDSPYIMDIEATIICEKESHKGIIIGKGGAMLRKIGYQARREIEEMLEEPVNLQLWVKVKKDWRDSDYLIKNFGYDLKEQS